MLRVGEAVGVKEKVRPLFPTECCQLSAKLFQEMTTSNQIGNCTYYMGLDILIFELRLFFMIVT